eukprot:CAMPEP_0177551274 /NCGR_PEP_ID=MMETSP0369-20130122/66057_1 /TAXON_ID=447022 ORGANISM="Scrippsiella hangoei-like, Strain SHHI-4" /NCGR_SAMPLE_ID=MMETSP0369 /ASSEMBLY_ACC=CAM_ASM_000364 /LENGTH=45 /DNA_ID= /DNA_START= /DNA_END= /DNA_ORIENTATION=
MAPVKLATKHAGIASIAYGIPSMSGISRTAKALATGSPKKALNPP